MAEQQRLVKLKQQLKQQQEKQQADAQAAAEKLADLKQQQADAAAKIQQQKQALAKQQAVKKLAAKKAAAKKKQQEQEDAVAEEAIAAEAAKQKQQKVAAAKKAQAQKQAQQIAQEKANEATMMRNVDKYSALIIQAISQHWIVPENADRTLSTQLTIRLASDGSVLNVSLAKSSGDALLDRSAEAAVYKASPLPVPDDAATFDRMRTINLTVRPESVLSGG